MHEKDLSGPDPTLLRRLAQARRDLGAGRPADEIERIERELMELRFEVGQAAVAAGGAAPSRPPLAAVDAQAPVAPPGEPRPFPPTVDFGDLDSEGLGRLLRTEGCIKVPGLIPETVAAELVDGIERAYAGWDAWVIDRDETTAWFEPLRCEPLAYVHFARPWVRRDGGLYTGDSPRVANRWFELVRAVGLFDLIAGYFGEDPVTTLNESALRRIGRNDGFGIEWHQDGSFLGDANAVNVWLCLSDTTRSPGLDIVSRRFDAVVETGTGSAGYDWTTGPEVVAELAETAPIVQPTFAPGDALIFDEMLLHRTTQPDPPLPDLRYAIETWFFRPSAFPEHQQIPLAL